MLEVAGEDQETHRIQQGKSSKDTLEDYEHYSTGVKRFPQENLISLKTLMPTFPSITPFSVNSL